MTRTDPRSRAVHRHGVAAGRRRPSRPPAADPGLSGRRLPARPFRAEMGAVRAIDQHHRRARADLHAVHDRAGDRPEKDHPRRQCDPGHVRRADLRLLCARPWAVSPDRHPARRRPLRRALSRRRRRAEQHRHHRQGALRQARARHAAGAHHARRAGGAGPVRDPVPGDPAEPERPAVRCACSFRCCASARCSRRRC